MVGVRSYLSLALLVLSSFAARQLTADELALRINEVSSSYHTIADEFDEYDDWLELYNSGDTTVDLGGLYLTDDLAENPARFRLPSVRLDPGEHLLIWTDGEPEQGPLHAPFALDDSGEEVALVRLDGDFPVVIDVLRFPDLSLKASYGRKTDGSAVLTAFGEPTPGKKNDPAKIWLAPPEFSLSGGAYAVAQTVRLSSAVAGVEIRYTTDGSEPGPSSPLYQSPLVVPETGQLRSRSFKPGFAPSWVVTRSFLIGEDIRLDAVAIAMDPADLFSDEEGIYVAGTNGIPGNCETEPRNWNQPWEKPAHVTFIELSGSVGFAIDAGISIGGQCTRRRPQKSLDVKARSRWGFSEIRYRLFPDREDDEFKSLRLRNSGNDVGKTFFRDGFMQALVDGELDLEVQSFHPVVVFLNGEYWGIHNIRDRQDDDYLNQKFPEIDKDNLDLIRDYNVDDVLAGTDVAYEDLYEYIENNDLSRADRYAEVASRIEVSNFIDYNAFQIFIGNFDWPRNNVKLWRERVEGSRWRWIVFDVDNGFGGGRQKDPDFDFVFNAYADPDQPVATLFLRKLLENRSFREEFIQRFATHLNVLYDPPRVIETIDRFAAQIEDEIPRHAARWRDEEGIPSLDAWRSDVEFLRDYARERRDAVREHIRENFDIDRTYTLRLAFDADSGGRVFLGGDEFPAPFDYRGVYFSGIPLRLLASPRPGFDFVRWEETGQETSSITYTGQADATLTPVFRRRPSAGALVGDGDLAITEIHYHPLDSEEFEFVEILNVSGRVLDLSGVSLAGGATFTFPVGASLAPGAYVVIVENEASFRERYMDPSSAYFFTPITLAGQWDGRLSNSGEEISLRGGLNDGLNAVLLRIPFDDAGGWPLAADGQGFSLELRDPSGLPAGATARDLYLADGGNWRASAVLHGSPGRSGSLEPAPSGPGQVVLSVAGAGAAPSGDDERVVVFDGSIEWRSETEDGVWDGLCFTATGRGDESRLIESLAVYVDTNRNGVFDAADARLGSPLTIPRDDARLSFEFGTDVQILESGTAQRFFLTARRAGGGISAATLWPLALVLVMTLAARVRARGNREGGVRTGRAHRHPLLASATFALAISISLLPLGCGGGGGGGGGSGGPAPSSPAEVRFEILEAEDIQLRGARTGALGAPVNLPVRGPVVTM